MAIVELKKCFKCGEEDRQEFGLEKQLFKFDWFAAIKDGLNQIHGLKVNPEKKVWVCHTCIVEHHRVRSDSNNYYHIGELL